MSDDPAEPDLNVSTFTSLMEDFTSIFIRLPLVEKLSFTTVSVLHALSRRGPMRLHDLTVTEQLSQPAITQLVTRLEQDGLLERHSDPHDGRVVLVALTARGEHIIAARQADRVRQLTRFFEQLSVDDRRAIAAALPALARVIDAGQHALPSIHPRPPASSTSTMAPPRDEE